VDNDGILSIYESWNFSNLSEKEKFLVEHSKTCNEEQCKKILTMLSMQKKIFGYDKAEATLLIAQTASILLDEELPEYAIYLAVDEITKDPEIKGFPEVAVIIDRAKEYFIFWPYAEKTVRKVNKKAWM